MKRNISFLVLLTAFIQPVLAQISELPITNSESVIAFSVGFAGGITNIEGRFNEFSGALGYKTPTDITSLYADVRIKVSSLNTGDKQRDEDLLGEGFFDVENYSEIAFKSNQTIHKDGSLTMIGSFSMLGKTIELEIPFERTHPEPLAWMFGEPRIAIKGSIMLNRIDFGIPKSGWDNILPSLGSMTLSENVEITLVIMAVGPGLGDILAEEVINSGPQAAIDKYKSLEKIYGPQKNTYNFGTRSIIGVGLQLVSKDRPDDAIAIADFGAKLDPKNFLIYYTYAKAYEAKNDKDKAIKNYEKSLALNPKFSRAQKALEKLKQ